MEVRKEHFVDAGERDAAGLYDYYYAYWIFSFRDGSLTLIARSYDDEPKKAHFLRKEHAGNTDHLAAGDLTGPLFTAACDYLRRVEGKTVIAVLKGDGYHELEAPAKL
jgi:hypothetical protein